MSSLIERLAGAEKFAKGTELFESGAIIKFQNDNGQLKAQIQDKFVYDISLRLSSSSYDGGCTCPESEGFDFCEHCVAVALFAEQEQRRHAELLNGGPADRVRALLESMSEQDIREELFKLITAEAARLEKWSMIADASNGNLSPKLIRQKIVKALPLKDLWRSEQVRNYFEKARNELLDIFDVIDRNDAETALAYYQFCLIRYDKVIERFEDSSGYRNLVFYLIESHLIQCVKRLSWKSTELASFLLGLSFNDFLHIDFGDVGFKFIEKENSDLKNEYYSVLESVLEKGKFNETAVSKSIANRLRESLSRFYLESNQIEKAMDILSEVATSFSDFINIVEKLMTSHCYDTAQHYLCEAKKFANSYSDTEQLLRLEYNLNKAKNEKSTVVECAWSLFEHTLQMTDYKLVLEAIGDNETEIERAHKRAEAILESTIDKKLPIKARNYLPLIEFYIYNGLLSKALAINEKSEIPFHIQHDLAQACLLNDLQSRGAELYKQLILHLPSRGKSKDYEFAIELLLELEEFSDRLDDPMFIDMLVIELQESFSNKPTFLRLLELNFSH